MFCINPLLPKGINICPTTLHSCSSINYRQTIFGFLQSSVVTKADIGRKVTGGGMVAITNWHLLAGVEDADFVDEEPGISAPGENIDAKAVPLVGDHPDDPVTAGRASFHLTHVELLNPRCDPMVDRYDAFHVVHGDRLVEIVPIDAARASQ